MEDKNDILIRKFRLSDIEGVVSLLNKVFNGSFSKEWWEWKYLDNPNGFNGEDGDIWVAEHDKKIIGHYAILPEKIKINSDYFNIAQSVDTATDPNYRGKGIFTTLAKKVYEDANNRYSFIFGFPSKMASRGFNRLGWKELLPVTVYINILNYDLFLNEEIKNRFVRFVGKYGLKLLKILHNISVFNIGGDKVKICEVNKFPNEINNFYEKILNEKKIHLVRKEKYLNWKFSDKFSSHRILLARSLTNDEILGYIVLKKRDKILDILDIMTKKREEKAMLNLLNSAKNYGISENMNIIRCWYPFWHKNVKVFKKSGFANINTLKKYAKKYVMQLIIYELKFKNISYLKKWFYTNMDSDYPFII